MKGSKITRLLKKKGYPVSRIARKRGVHISMVSKVVHGKAKARHIADEIAYQLEKPIEQIWPGKYDN